MNRTHAVLIVAIVVSLLWGTSLPAVSGDSGPIPAHQWDIDFTVEEPSPTEFKLLASDGEGSDNFGHSVSISGDFAVVGTWGDDDRGYNSGSIYVFKRTGDIWVRQAKLVASDGDDRDRFGASVSISGDYVIVGTDEYDDWDRPAGSAYVFKRSGDAWVQQTKLVASDGHSGDHFGTSVSINGDDAIVGAWGDDDPSQDAGSAYVFKRSGDAWIQQAKLVASDGESADHFGVSVSISGDDAIVGADLDDDKVVNAGSAYVFKRSGDAWVQQTKLVPSGGDTGDQFGVSVSISGDDAIVGADGYRGISTGLAYVFKRHGDAWMQQAELVASDRRVWDRFGYSVSISGDYAIVGADTSDEKGNDSGAAYLFKRSGDTWTQLTKLMASDAAAGDYFGMSVSINGDYVIAGAWGDDDEGPASGSAYVFRISAPTYTLTVTSGKGGSVVTPGEGSFSYDYGQSVAVEAEPANTGWHFVGWSGTAVDAGKVDNRNDPETTVLVDGDYTLHASFVCEQHTLSVSSTPGGSAWIVVIVDGVAHGWLGGRTLRFDHGTQIGLLAVPDAGYAFKNWSGTMWSTDDSLVFVLDQDHDLTANFAVPPAP